MAERLHKALARAGVASRRAAERLVQAGRVAVNGEVVCTPGALVDPDNDHITVDGQAVATVPPPRYLVLNKPMGYVSTARDERGRPTVLDLAPAGGRLYPVGRLDADSEGLQLLTNDGDFALRATHPRYGVEKEYRVLVRGAVEPAALDRLRHGVQLAEGRARPVQVEVLSADRQQTWLLIVLRQGWKRQVRRMLAAVGYSVERLVRVRMGALTLGDLAVGHCRELTAAEARRVLEQQGGRIDHRAGWAGSRR
jgi:23S rRNA pseudouridine2605 synthase